MTGLINIGAGLSEMGKSVANTAGEMALSQQKLNLENQKLTLADQLLGAREHTARVETGLIAEGEGKNLSLIAQKASMDAYLRASGYQGGLADFGYNASGGTSGTTASPPSASGAAPTPSDSGGATPASPSAPAGAATIPGGVVPVGGKGKVMGIALPPGWTMQQAAIAGPAGLAKAWEEWSKPGIARPGSAITYYDFATQKMKTLYQQPNLPPGQLYDQENNTFVKIGGADAAIRKPEEIKADVAAEHDFTDVYHPETGTTSREIKSDVLKQAKSGEGILAPPPVSSGAALLSTGNSSPGPQPDGSFKQRDGSIIPPPPKATKAAGGVLTGPSAAQKATQGVYEETIKGWNDSVLQAAQAEQRFQAMAEALRSFQSGAWATTKVAVGRQLIAAGMDSKTVAEITGAAPDKAQVILKNNFGAALATLSASRLGRITQNEIFAMQDNLANPKLEPEANLEIIAQGIGIARFQQSLASGWNNALRMGYSDPLTYQDEFLSKNPFQKFIDEARTEVGPLRGMTFPAPPPDAIRDLRAAGIKDEKVFDRHFGPGAARRILGEQK